MTRAKKLIFNTLTPIIVQVLTVLSGLILPSLRLACYGSEVNGMISSITQFLSLISFLELGVGAVVRSALYKPLADNDTVEVSKIITSAQKFFSKLAYILLVYIAFLCIVYPIVVSTHFNSIYIITLILASSINLFAQYYFGIVNRLLLTADQRGYIQYTLQAITIVLNFIIWIVLIKCNAPVQLVVLGSSLVYLISPVYMKVYVDRFYKVNRHERYDTEPIVQKWNGLAQHIAAIVLDYTDTIVLSLFASLTDVSIYSMYQLVVINIKNMYLAAMNGVQALMGDMIARKEKERLEGFFGLVEWITHTVTVLIFGCVLVLLVPFVVTYTRNITDANYYQPIFCFLLVIAYTAYCIRVPYNIAILAAGHYKQTQHIFIIAAIMNLSISIIMVKHFGLIGVAIGTLIAMIYQTLHMVYYLSKNILNWPIRIFVKQVFVDVLSMVIGYFATSWIKISNLNFGVWFIMAVEVFAIWFVICLLINAVFYRRYLIRLKQLIQRKIVR